MGTLLVKPEEFQGCRTVHDTARPVHIGGCSNNDLSNEDIGENEMRPSYIVGFVVGFIILLIVFLVSVVGWKLFHRDFDKLSK